MTYESSVIHTETNQHDDEATPYEEFEDFDQTDFLDDEDAEELDFEIDETYRGDPEDEHPTLTRHERTPMDSLSSENVLT